MGYSLNNYKLKQAYRKNRQLRRKLRGISKVRKYFEAMPAGVANSTRMGAFGADWATADAEQKARRRALRFYGQGDYKSILKYGSRGLGALAGGAMGYMSGGLSGAGAGLSSGWSRGADFSKFMGWGDYSSGNQIIDGGSSNQQQISVNQTDLTGDIYVARTEFVQNIVVTGPAGGTSVFENRSFGLNPGLQVVFPWLAQIAQCFTLYDFEGLIFQFKPLFSEDAGTSNSLGKVIMATEYDPAAPDFITSVQMSNYDYANSSKPSCGMYHGVETAQRQQAVNMMYVRTGTSTRDLIFTDVGKFQLATEGVPLPAGATSVIIGELWVTYRVKLSRAEIYSALLGNNITQDVQNGTSSNTALWTATSFVKSTNTIGMTVSNISATSLRLTFPQNLSLGYYQIMIQFRAVTPFTTQVFNGPTNASNCQVYRPGYEVPGGPVVAVSSPEAVTGTTANTSIMQVFWVYVNSPGLLRASIDVNVSSALVTGATWRLWVTQQPSTPSFSFL